jgi:hypothetical protein
VPYGYDADPITKQLVPNEAEARRVRLLFQRAARGELPTAIASAINFQHWPTKVYHSKRSGKVTGGGLWTARQVLIVLRNPVYMGRFADGDGSRPGCHEAIVAADVFDAVQMILASRRTSDPKPRTQSGFPFRQKLVCPRCGRFLLTYMITAKKWKQGSLAYCYYRCRSTAGGRARCKGIQYSVHEIDTAVEQVMSSPDAWHLILGQTASDEDIKTAMIIWEGLAWPYKARFFERYIDRITFPRDLSEISITFNPAVNSVFSEHWQGLT